MENQLGTVEDYSTVVTFSPNLPNIPHLHNKNYYLTMVLRVTSSNLWTSPYSDYQHKLFDIIREKHEEEGLNFVQISDWLNKNKYKTPRGKVFTPGHVWSIYTKKIRNEKRFSRESTSEIIGSNFDVVNLVPDP